jgi:uncharacterized protein DUF29
MNNISYENDYYGWAEQQANYIKQKEYAKLDFENLFEEIESLGKSEKRTLKSHLETLFIHKLKVIYQAHKHTRSWDHSIIESSHRCEEVLIENPSLKPKIKDLIKSAYWYARSRASLETGLDQYEFPVDCPWTVKDVFPEIEDKYI